MDWQILYLRTVCKGCLVQGNMVSPTFGQFSILKQTVLLRETT